MIDLRDGWLWALSFFICWSKLIEKLMQIAFVIAQRVRTDIALVTQVIEKLREKLIEHGVRLPRLT